MPRARPSDQRRRRPHDGEDASDNEGPSNTSRVQAGGGSDDDEDGDIPMDGSFAADDAAEEQLVKKLVRYALACDYARMPIRRDGIREKVLGNNSRAFRKVFEGAQIQLRQVFGMEMTELPTREKKTLKERQKASARKAGQGGADKASTATSYILTTTLPPQYRSQSILAPSLAPSAHDEATYAAFYTVVISLIVLNGSGELSDLKLKRYLIRLNAAQNLPIGISTDDVLARCVRQGYLDKFSEKSTDGDDMVTWSVGPRGKVEVPPDSVARFVREVWGQQVDKDFEKKLSKSLGIDRPARSQGETIAEE